MQRERGQWTRHSITAPIKSTKIKSIWDTYLALERRTQKERGWVEEINVAS